MTQHSLHASTVDESLVSRNRKEDWKLVRETLSEGLSSLGVIALIWVCFLLFGGSLGTAGMYVLILSGILLVLGWRGWKHPSERLVSRVFVVSAWFSFLYYLTFYLYAWFGGWGLLGIVLVGSILAGITIARHWEKYMWWVRHIERRFLYNGLTAEERRKVKR